MSKARFEFRWRDQFDLSFDYERAQYLRSVGYEPVWKDWDGWL